MKKILLSISLTGLFFPVIAFGAFFNSYEAGGKTIIYDGLVPCGKGVCVYSGSLPGEEVVKTLEAEGEGETLENICKAIAPQLSLSSGGASRMEWRESRPCQFCDFFVMTNGILQFLMTRIIPVVAVLMLVVGGVFFFFAGANPNALKTAKEIITSVVIGLVIIFAAFVIVGTILNAIGLANWTENIYKSWLEGKFFQINCQ